MSAVPAWKQAILDRKKKAEEEQRKKEEEEAAYLASLPPWKRALVKKQRETQSPTSTLERKDSKERSSQASNKWMEAVQKAREGSPKLPTRSPWAKPASVSTPTSSLPVKEVKLSSAQNTSSPKLPSRSFGALSTFASKPSTVKPDSSVKPTSSFNRPSTTSTTPQESTSQPRTGRRGSVTVLPASDSAVPATTTPVISGGVSLRPKETTPTVHVSDKRRSFEGDEDEDAKLAAMPAWKKALILRRRAAAGQPNKEPKPQPIVKETSAPQKTLRPVKESMNDATNLIKKENTVKETPKPVVREPEPQAFQGNDEVDSPYTEPIKSQKHIYTDNTPTKPSAIKTKKEKVAKASQKPQEERKPKPQEERKVKTNTIPASKSPSAKPITTKKTTKPAYAAPKRPQPEIVNRPRDDADGPTKLVEKEGVLHRPPVYKEVDEWKNVGEDDPAFKKLPLWKQALIKRRRSDIANRSRTVTPEPTKQQKPSSTKTASTSVEQSLSMPSWRADLLKRNAKTGNDDSNNMKNISNRFGSGRSNDSSQGSSKLQPVRKAPTPARSAPPPPQKEEPMFSYSFSKRRTLDAGSDSEDSDSDLEDVTVTNIDDASDEDSGIGKDGIVVTSYKVTNSDYTPPVSPTRSQPANANIKTNNTGSIPETDSKSILVDPQNKPKKHLRRVSFSDSNLTEEHFYPKYTYHDYDDVNSDNEDGSSKSSENSGLAQRIHPSLLPSNETDSDIYRYSPSKASPMRSTSSSLGQYTPNIMSSYYNDMVQSHLSGNSYGNNSPATKKQEPKEEPVYNGPVNDAANDFYSHLNADTAALLW